MFLGLPDPHPDPLVRGTDSRIRIRIQIRTKMSRTPILDPTFCFVSGRDPDPTLKLGKANRVLGTGS
jgi:hypothetical protein